MNERVSYWLVPAGPDKARLSKIISDLAKCFDALVFEPHVTVYSGPFDPRDNVEEIIASAAAGISEVVLQTTGIAHSNQFTKTLFVEFANDEHLTKLSDALKRGSAQVSDYQVKPHLSLLYAPVAAEIKERWARELSVPALVRFDTVKAIVNRGVTRTREDVEAWRGIAEKGLAHK